MLVDTNMAQCWQNVDFLTANKSLVPCGDKSSLGFIEAHPELPLTFNAVTDVGKTVFFVALHSSGTDLTACINLAASIFKTKTD